MFNTHTNIYMFIHIVRRKIKWQQTCCEYTSIANTPSQFNTFNHQQYESYKYIFYTKCNTKRITYAWSRCFWPYTQTNNNNINITTYKIDSDQLTIYIKPAYRILAFRFDRIKFLWKPTCLCLYCNVNVGSFYTICNERTFILTTNYGESLFYFIKSNDPHLHLFWKSLKKIARFFHTQDAAFWPLKFQVCHNLVIPYIFI